MPARLPQMRNGRYPGCVGQGKLDGFIDSEGNWKLDKTNWLLDTLQTNRLHCPVSGQKYDVTYVVGTHPQCPTHGDVVQFYGYVPHQSTLRSSFWWFAPTISFFGALICGIWIMLPFWIARRGKNQEDHK
jgi:hypothetical protein